MLDFAVPCNNSETNECIGHVVTVMFPFMCVTNKVQLAAACSAEGREAGWERHVSKVQLAAAYSAGGREVGWEPTGASDLQVSIPAAAHNAKGREVRRAPCQVQVAPVAQQDRGFYREESTGPKLNPFWALPCFSHLQCRWNLPAQN